MNLCSLPPPSLCYVSPHCHPRLRNLHTALILPFPASWPVSLADQRSHLMCPFVDCPTTGCSYGTEHLDASPLWKISPCACQPRGSSSLALLCHVPTLNTQEGVVLLLKGGSAFLHSVVHHLAEVVHSSDGRGRWSCAPVCLWTEPVAESTQPTLSHGLSNGHKLQASPVPNSKVIFSLVTHLGTSVLLCFCAFSCVSS